MIWHVISRLWNHNVTRDIWYTLGRVIIDPLWFFKTNITYLRLVFCFQVYISIHLTKRLLRILTLLKSIKKSRSKLKSVDFELMGAIIMVLFSVTVFFPVFLIHFFLDHQMYIELLHYENSWLYHMHIIWRKNIIYFFL